MCKKTTPDWLRRRRSLLLVAVLLIGLLTYQGVLRRSIHLNVMSLKAVLQLQGVSPLTMRDLLGLTERPLREDWNDLIDQYAVWLDSASGHQLPQGALIQRDLLLLSGQSERFLSLSDARPLDDLGSYLQAVAFGQQHNLLAVTAVLREISSSPEVLALAGRTAWDNQVEPDVELAIGAMDMLLHIGEQTAAKQVEAYRILSYAYERTNRPAAALEAAQAWRQAAHADCESTTRLVALYLRTNDPQGADGILQQQTRTDQRCPAFVRQMAQVQDQLGNLDGAMALYQQALANEPTDAYLNGYFGNLLYRRKDFRAAIPYLEVAEKSNDAALQQMAADLLDQISKELK